jgi:hypothetical protein
MDGKNRAEYLMEVYKIDPLVDVMSAVYPVMLDENPKNFKDIVEIRKSLSNSATDTAAKKKQNVKF